MIWGTETLPWRTLAPGHLQGKGFYCICCLNQEGRYAAILKSVSRWAIKFLPLSKQGIQKAQARCRSGNPFF